MPTDEVLEPSMEQLAYATKELQWFLRHEAVLKAFQSTEIRIRKEWERAQTTPERELAWHKLQAFKTLQVELRALSQRDPVP